MKNENNLPRFSGLIDEAEERSVGQIMDQVRLAAVTTTETRRHGWRPGSLMGVACLAAAALFMFVATQPSADGEDLTNNTERFEYLCSAGVPLNCLSEVGWNCPMASVHPKEVKRSVGKHGGVRCTDCHDIERPAPEPPQDKRPRPHQPDANACCTDCHNAAEPQDAMDDFKPLAQSCLACHSS